MTSDAFAQSLTDGYGSGASNSVASNLRTNPGTIAPPSLTETTELQHSPSQDAGRRDHACIIVLNWNGWRDTIECLESLLRLDFPNYKIIVCDNASSDDSWNEIGRWANGDRAVPCSNPRLAHLTSPPVTKPVSHVCYSSPQESLISPSSNCPLVLIQTGGNLGFAMGNNVGLRYALSQTDCEYFWLLNNDTVVEPSALLRLIESMKEDRQTGICGSMLRDYTSPETVQAFGVRQYSAWSGRVLPVNPAKLPSRHVDYVHGASMMVRREFLETVGLLDESYFLYFEELDRATRSQGLFRLAFAPLSTVYHKEGASIGTHNRRQERSLLAERFATRNRLLFTRKFHPAFVPTVLGFVILTALHRTLTGDIHRAGQILSAAWEGLTCPKQPLRPSRVLNSRTAVTP